MSASPLIAGLTSSPVPTVPGAAARADVSAPGTAGFDHLLGRETARQASRASASASDADASPKPARSRTGASTAAEPSASRREAQPSSDSSSSGSPSSSSASSGSAPRSAAGSAAGERTDRDADERVDSDAAKCSDDPGVLLGWLQAQTQTQTQTLTPTSAQTPASVPGVVPAAFAPVGIAKPLVPIGDTPPTQAPGAPAPASLSATGSLGDPAIDCGVASFQIPEALAASNDASASSAPLTPALSAALSAALATGGGAAPEIVARGVEQFQALLARPDPVPLVAPPTAPPTPAPTVQALLAAPLATDSPDLPVRLGERVQWLVDSGIQEARLQLHPRELGTVNVHVRLEARGASVWFAAEHPAARAALESALPLLRERFAGDGVALGQAQVTAQTSGWSFGGSSRHGTQQGASQPSSRGTAAAASPGDALDALRAEAATSDTARRIVRVGLVDRYV